jgi:hypothetical protein
MALLAWREQRSIRRCVVRIISEGDEPVNTDSVVLRHQSALASLLSISFIVYSSSLILHYSIYPINSVCFIYHLCPGSPRPAISTLSCRSLSIPRFPPSCTSRTARGAIPSPAWVRSSRSFCIACLLFRFFLLLCAVYRRSALLCRGPSSDYPFSLLNALGTVLNRTHRSCYIYTCPPPLVRLVQHVPLPPVCVPPPSGKQSPLGWERVTAERDRPGATLQVRGRLTVRCDGPLRRATDLGVRCWVLVMSLGQSGRDNNRTPLWRLHNTPRAGNHKCGRPSFSTVQFHVIQ